VKLQEFQRVLRQAFLVPILTLLALAGILLWQIAATQKAQRWLDHSDEISGEIAELESLIIDQETGLRGYELTGDATMLVPFYSAAQPIQGHFAQLRRQIADDPVKLRDLERISTRYETWLSFAQAILSSPANFTNRNLNRHGGELMYAVRDAVRQMARAEDQSRQQWLKHTISQERREIVVLLSGTALVGLMLSFFSLSRLHKVSGAYRQSLFLLEKRGEKLRTILRSIGDAVIVCQADGSIEFMNPVAEDLTGWKEEEAAGRALAEIFRIVNEETNEPAENPVEKVRRLKKVIGLANHTALIARDGVRRIIDDSAAPILSQDGQMTGIVLVFRDVTEKRRAEAALAVSEKLAVAGRLAASIAHEIHNPLDSIGNLHYLLAQEKDAARRDEYLKMAQQELDRTLQISRSLLSLYREPNAPVEVNLGELLSSVLLLLRRRLDHQGTVVTQQNKDNIVIEGFPAELRQVFTNLILNAAEAAGRPGKILIQISRSVGNDSRAPGVTVEIYDSGAGISPQVASKLFQPFFTTKGSQGTGLGLWISLGIVQKHGGSIHIGNSDLPEYTGACVQVYLPARTLATAQSRSTPYVG